MDRAIFVLSALLLNALLAGPRQWTKAIGLTRLASTPAHWLRDLERRLDREHRGTREREMRGTVVTVTLVVASLLMGVVCGWLQLGFGELLFLVLALPVRPLWDMAGAINRRLKTGDVRGARAVLDGTAWRHHALMDEYGLARAAIEILAVGFSERIAAPALWYLALGLPGLWMSKTVWLLQETLVRPGQARQYFSRTAQAVHYILHYIPSRLTAILWLIASLFSPGRRWREVARPVLAGFIKLPPQMLSLAAAASVLDVSLGGPSSIYAYDGWIGNGTARPETAQVGRGLYFFILLHLLMFLLIGAALR